MDLPRLEVVAPESPPHQISLNDPALTIGRHRSNRLVIPDERASRFHCVVEHTAEGFRLRDLHSKNGTKLNGERISSAYLKVGDSFRIGKTNFAFTVPEGYVLPPPPHPPKPDPAHMKKNAPHSPAVAAAVVLPMAAKGGHRDDDGVIPMPIDLPTPSPNKMPGPSTPAPSGHGTPRSSPVAAGLSFAQPFSPEHHTPVPAHPPPRSHTQPAQPAGYYASPPAPANVPPHAQETPAPPSPPQNAEPTAVPPPQPLAPHMLAPIIDALRGFAHFEHDVNPDAMLGEAHLIPVNVAQPLDQAMAQLHPNDPAAQPLYLFKQVALAALRARASHILIEPRASGATLRVRVDGSLVEIVQLPRPVADQLTGVLRNLTNVAANPGNPTQPQEGRCRLVLPDRAVECRLSITPSLQGVALSLRLADPKAIPQTLPDLGLPLPATRLLANAMKQPAGLVLVTGPALAGVTTTLYATLRQLDLRQLHVISIESQIDTPMDGVTQVPFDDTQPASLGPMIRVALKQSPSALLVGDLPDHDAAQAVIHAADQGYLVLAGLHARDALASIARLLDLGIPARHVAANLRLIVSLRLVRLLCPHCKIQTTPSQTQQQRLSSAGVPWTATYTAKGCPRCFGSGYMLRRPLAAAISIDDAARAGIEKSSNTADLRTMLPQAGASPFRGAADELVAQGLTSFEEADRATA